MKVKKKFKLSKNKETSENKLKDDKSKSQESPKEEKKTWRQN